MYTKFMTAEEKSTRLVQLAQSVPNDKWRIGIDKAIVTNFSDYMLGIYSDATFFVMKHLHDENMGRLSWVSLFRAKDESLLSKYRAVCTMLDEVEIDSIAAAIGAMTQCSSGSATTTSIPN
jgi:hypothetical protein